MVWTMEDNINTFVLTVDKVNIFLPLSRVVGAILTIFHGRIQVFKAPLWTFGDLVQFTPCLPIHGMILCGYPSTEMERHGTIGQS